MKKSVTTKLKPNWTGRTLSETVYYNDRLFKIVTGLRNGGGENRVYILGTTGWEYFLNTQDIPKEDYDNDASYVSDEKQRKEYSENLNKAYKEAIIKIFS